MSLPESSTSSFSAQMQEAIDAAQQSLREGETFFEQFGLDGNKVRAYLESMSTPEMQAQAQAAVEEDMRAVEEDARAGLSLTNPHSTNTPRSPRRLRNMI